MSGLICNLRNKFSFVGQCSIQRLRHAVSPIDTYVQLKNAFNNKAFKSKDYKGCTHLLCIPRISSHLATVVKMKWNSKHLEKYTTIHLHIVGFYCNVCMFLCLVTFMNWEYIFWMETSSIVEFVFRQQPGVNLVKAINFYQTWSGSTTVITLLSGKLFIIFFNVMSCHDMTCGYQINRPIKGRRFNQITVISREIWSVLLIDSRMAVCPQNRNHVICQTKFLKFCCQYFQMDYKW